MDRHAGSGCGPHDHDGIAAIARPVRVSAQQRDRPGDHRHQPRAGGRAIDVGRDPARSRRGGGSLRRRQGPRGRRARSRTRDGRDAVHDVDVRPHRLARAACRDGCGRGQLFRADRGGSAAPHARGSGQGGRRHQCRRSVRTVRVRTDLAGTDPGRRLDGRDVVARGDYPGGPAARARGESEVACARGGRGTLVAVAGRAGRGG